MVSRIIATFLFELRQIRRLKGLWILALIALWGCYAYLSTIQSHQGWNDITQYSREIRQANVYYLNLSHILSTFRSIGFLAIGVALLISLLITGRPLKRPIENMLYTKPITTLELASGRLLALLVTLLIFSLIPIASLIYFYSQYRYYAWQPKDFITLWIFGLVWPMLFTAVVGWWARYTFRRLILAAGAALAVIGCLTLLGNPDYLALLPIPESTHTVAVSMNPMWFLMIAYQSYHVPLGFLIDSERLLLLLAGNTAVVAILFCSSLFYTRRTIPRREPPLAIKQPKYDTPTFRSLFYHLRPDRRVGKDALILSIFAILCLAVFCSWSYQKRDKKTTNANKWHNEWKTVSKNAPALREALADPLRIYCGAPPPEGLYIDHYDLDLKYDPLQNDLTADCLLRLVNSSPQAATRVPLLLNVGLNMDKATFEQSGRSVPFQKTFNQLWLAPESGFPAGSTSEIRLKYHGPLLEGLFKSQSSVGYTPKKMNRPVWALSEQDLFYPILPDSGSLTQNFFTARTQLEIANAEGQVVIAPGKDEGQRHSADFPLTRLTFIVGPFKPIRKTIAGTPVCIYCLPEREAIAKVFLEDINFLIRDTLQFLGPFPYPEIIFYDNITPGGFSGPGMQPVCLDTLQRSKQTLDYFTKRFNRVLNKRQYYLYLSLPDAMQLQDSIVDMYFQDSVHPAGSMSKMLSYYLPNYMRSMLIPVPGVIHKHPFRNQFDVKVNERLKHLPPLREMFKDTRYADRNHPALANRISDFSTWTPLDRKAMALVHMLRYMMGEDAFHQLLQDYLKQHRFETVTFENFCRLAEKDSDEDLEDFFQQWLDRSTLPVYGLTKTEALMFDDPDTMGMDYKVTIGIVNDGTGTMRVPIYLKTEGDDIIRDVVLASGEQEEIVINVPDRPLFTTIDPEGWILQGEYVYEKKRKGRISHPLTIIEPWQQRGFGRQKEAAVKQKAQANR